MWITPERPADTTTPMDWTGSPGGRLFARQPSVPWIDTGTDETGRTLWSLEQPAAGVLLVSMDTLPVALTLPGGFSVELAREVVPDANRLDLYSTVATFGWPNRRWWLDVCLVLRVRRNGTVVAEARRQFELFGQASVLMTSAASAQQFALSAGFYLDPDGDLALYAHAWDIATNALALETAPVINSPSLFGTLLAGPFGRGLTVTVLVPFQDTAETIGPVTLAAVPNATLPARSWFAHATPLEDRIPLVPDALPIPERTQDRLAWGRHRAQVAAAPLGWGMAPIEAAGHPEWVLGGGGVFHPDPWVHHPGASRLFDHGRPAALVPASDHRSNVSANDEKNRAVKSFQAKWDDPAGWSTGTLTIPLTLGAWNEYRTTGWVAKGGTFTPPGEATRTLEAVFLALSLDRVDATNLGGITDQADAVEVTRFVLRWGAACRATYELGAGLGTTTEWRTAQGSVVLTPADYNTLSNDLGQLSLSGTYTQGTYPTASTADIGGTLTLQAAW